MSLVSRSKRGHGNLFGWGNKASHSKRHFLRVWSRSARRRVHRKKEGDVVMMGVMRSGDSPPPLQASIPTTYDVPDDAGLNGRVTISSSSSPAIHSVKSLRGESGESDAEVISVEEAVPIVRKTLPTPEPQPPIEKNNGYDRKYTDEKRLVNDVDDDPCIIKCLYFTQQCCECTIM